MLIMYVVYCIVLKFNPQLEKWSQTWNVPCKKPVPEETGLVSYKSLDEERNKIPSYTVEPTPALNTAAGDGYTNVDPFDPLAAWDHPEGAQGKKA